MPNAARVNDLTAHGKPLGPGPGSRNVNIGHARAWRAIADTHQCPGPPGGAPHGAGVVTKGSKTVKINYLPAARVGDQVMEATGGPDAIAKGCKSVNIG